MTAFFFGPEGQRLYGYHHAPNDPGRSSGGVVLCPPWGSEYEYAHRSLLVLARRLAGAGRHVLRFDYSNTGDSWGETFEADLSRWVLDTAAAVEELRSLTDVGEVDLVGLRLGAFVAAQVARTRDDVRRVLLWDPIMDGPGWIDGRRVDRDGFIELDRARVSPGFVDQLKAVDVSAFEDLPADRTLLLITSDEAAGDPEGQSLPGRASIEVRTLEQPSPWIMDHSIWTGQVPMGAVGEIVGWLE